MNKIYLEIYNHREGFDSISDLIASVGSSIEYYLYKLVRYNLSYRDFTRDYGIDELCERLYNECPELISYPKAIADMRADLEQEPISGFDIFYWPKNKPIEVAPGCEVTLAKLNEAVEAYGLITYRRGQSFDMRSSHSAISQGYHVAEVYESVPSFDSFDRMHDKGGFQNFFISTQPLSADMLDDYLQLKMGFNSCLVTESLPNKFLPAIYNGGIGNMLIVARPKERK